MNKIDLKSFTLNEVIEELVKLGEKSYRGKQLFEWIHQKRVKSFFDISVISKSLKEKLDLKYMITNLKIVKRFDSKLDNTKKYLFSLNDGNIIESVAMEYKYGISVCISTQVGCRMGCSFCASTKGGLVRNLSSGEIVDQIYKIEEDLNRKVNSVVLMGSGEPLDNYENVIKFLNIIHEKYGKGLGYRHITLSTCGLVENIYRLADENIPITLSISLHSPFDEERKKIMPISQRYKISDIINGCKYYIEKTGRRVTFEYALIEGVNDDIKSAEKLTIILKDILCHVNIIPINSIKETSFSRPKQENIIKFKNILEFNGISTTIRREMGSDINAACGQLRRDYINSFDLSFNSITSRY